jgi:excisionase family DNA binding protein
VAVQREYLSPNELAELLGVSPFTIRRYIKLGELRAVKLLGGFRVHRDDLQRFLKAHEVNSAEEELSPEEATAEKAAPNPKPGQEANPVKPPPTPDRVSSRTPSVPRAKPRGAGAKKPRRPKQ